MKQNKKNTLKPDILESFQTLNSGVLLSTIKGSSVISLKNPAAPNDVVSDLVKLFDKEIYLINRRYEIIYTNQLDELSNKNFNLPCYKLIFNLDSPCQYCGFSFDDSENDKSDHFNSSITGKRVIRVKNHFDANAPHQDFSLTQSLLNKKNEPVFVDLIEVSQNDSIYDASDQLTTLGAHVQTVAHDLSNPITGLNLTRQQIVKILDSRDVVNTGDLRPLVDLLLKDIRRAAGVLSEIRNYSRPVNKSYRLVDLKSVLKSALDNVIRTYRSDNVNAVFHWNAGEHFTIAGNSAKLEQCFINIIKNSFEMFNLRKNSENNEVTVLVEKTDMPGMVKIQVIDNAGGISNEALTNVFKPYFTTKERFRGLGLGLYIAGRILKEHNSSISIESIGEKTIVKMYMKQRENIK